MALKFSEMIALRTDLALALEAGFESYLEEIAGGLGDYLTPLLEAGETAVDFRLQIELLRRGVRRLRRRLDSLDVGVVEQTHGDDKVRAQLDQRRDAVDGKLRQVRSAFRGFFGLEHLRRVGLKGEFPTAPVRLHRHGLVVKASLLSPDLDLEPVLDFDLAPGTSPTKQLAAQLEPELSELGALLTGRQQENTKAADVRLRRQRAIREFDREIRAIVRMAQGMFRLAGRDDHAERFRPALRRVVRRIKKAEQQEAAAQAADADAAASSDGAESEATA